MGGYRRRSPRLRPVCRPAGHGVRSAPGGRRQAWSWLRLLLRESARLPPCRAAEQWELLLCGDELCKAASHGGAPKVSMGALADPGTAEWTLEYEASFSEIWAAESYKASGLPEKTPVLALIHPKNPDVVYFFLEDHLFGVDMRTKSVVECEPYEPSTPRKKGSFSSWLVLPFELPPAFSAGNLSPLTCTVDVGRKRWTEIVLVYNFLRTCGHSLQAKLLVLSIGMYHVEL